MTASILAFIGTLTVVLTAATRIPAALAALIRSFIPVLAAIRAVHAFVKHPGRTDGPQS
ncbi:hypothetical protein [Streptacidiphilus melanogenes]|uniref:hypothetical protein n=1 Tax=Streptacidiphilus melanogenes TaxID=411235 RepID=UPI000B1D1BE6|nr:hypothetical protein [Streptacidiphilus melanogenes]